MLQKSMDANQKLLTEAFLQLPQSENQVQCQYIWVDGSLRNLRCKSKTWQTEPRDPKDLPSMEFCGSATDFDTGNLADYYSHPVRLYRDPFRVGNNKLVYCETRTREGLPTFANNRYRLWSSVQEVRTMLEDYSFQQPYTLLRKDGKPLSYLDPAYSPDSKSGFVCGRDVADAHYAACLYAGVHFDSLEPTSNFGQWIYSIGPCSRVKLGDDVWMSRLILIRVAEDFGVTVSFDTVLTSATLLNVTASLSIETAALEKLDQQRVTDLLLSKFIDKKVVTLPNKVLLKNIGACVDPYWIVLQVSESISSRNK